MKQDKEIKNKNKKSVLGRGMAALIQSQSTLKTTPLNEQPKKETSKNLSTLTLKVSDIEANRDQPRKIFHEKDLQELAASIKENGIIQPIIVRERVGEKYQIIAGERRFRAAQLVGLSEVPVVIKKTTEKETMVMAILENVQRADLNCVEESLAYYNLINEYKLTQDAVAKQLGKSRSSIANSLRLLTLPKSVLDFLKTETLSFGHGKVLVAVKDSALCEALAKESVRSELSVRELEELIKGKKKEKVATKPVQKSKKFDHDLDHLTRELESQTGFHLNIKRNSKGSGSFQIKFNSEAELNTIIDFLKK